MSYIYNTSHFLDYQKLDGTTITYDLSIQHTFIKKFDLIYVQANNILERDIDLNILYDEFITILNNRPIDIERLREVLPELIEKIDKNAEELNYWRFSYVAPKKINEYKLHIDKNGYLDIMKASVRAKFICAPITTLREEGEHASLIRYIYSLICKEMIDSGTQFKLERIIDSIVLTSSAKGLDSKSQLWTFFSTSKGLEPQNLALRERNAILYKGLPSIANGLNPINWFVAMARTAINFQMKDKINEIHIAFSSPIESTYENSSDMLKIFVYEEVTSNRKLKRLFNEFPYAVKMSKEYVYPITNWIAAPFISKVFNVGNLNITRLVNILILNLFTYKFMRTEEIGWKLFDLLTYRVNVKKDPNFKIPIINNKVAGAQEFFTQKMLTTLIRNRIHDHNFSKYCVYSDAQIEELFKSALRSLLTCEFFNYEDAKITFDPIKISNEYINYIYNLLTGKYDRAIENARIFLKRSIDEDGQDDNNIGSTSGQILEK